MNHEAKTFEAYRPTLLALAYRMLGDMARAEDMVQEALGALAEPTGRCRRAEGIPAHHGHAALPRRAWIGAHVQRIVGMASARAPATTQDAKPVP